ncbi:MAG: PAS domain-containing protein [Deltaproteobacteria bacterium]|nr:PAS domain-containing protein [Deltaproteobacteria bacterium]
MKTLILSNGLESQKILGLIAQRRPFIPGLKVAGLVDPDPDSPALALAREQGWPAVADLDQALKLPGLDLVLDLSGSEEILTKLQRLVPPGIRVMDRPLADAFLKMETEISQLKADLAERQAVVEKFQKEVSHRQAFVQQLDRERAQLQQILDSLPDAVLVVNHDRRVEWVNARFLEMTGLKPEDLEKECREVNPFCGEVRDQGTGRNSCGFDELERIGQPIQFIHFEPGKDAAEEYYRIILNPIYGESNRIEKIIETARPITRQVLRTRETEESEMLFRQLVDNAHDMITIKDLEGRYLVINQQAADLLGMSPMDCLGRTDEEIFPAKLARILTRKDRELLKRKEHFSSEESLVAKGQTKYFNSVRFPLKNYKGQVVGVCCITRDITEYKKLQQAVIESEKLAAIGKLAGSVAHEINNPLTGILTFAEELLLDAKPGDPAVEDYEVIIREALRCRRIVSDVLDFVRIRPSQRKSMDINLVIERALSLVQGQAPFQDVTLDRQMTPDLPLVRLDPDQMQQVFLNIVINAAEAMNNGGRLTIRSGLSADGSSVQVELQDEGPGIPPDKMEEIFEPFYSTKSHTGNGLGLSVVKSIVDQHGGTIEVESELGQGSVFIVSLPLTPQEERSAAHV